MQSANGSNGHAYPERGSLTGLLPAYPMDANIPIVGDAFDDGYDGGFD